MENETFYTISTETIDDVFEVILHVVGNYTKIDSDIISPTEVKIDFIINYPYISNTSMIALKAKINSLYETETEIEPSQPDKHHDSAINIIAGTHTGYFSWMDHAMIDNVSKPVNITIIQVGGSQSENKDTIYFSYTRGKHIIHDPKVGVVSLSSLTFVPSLPSQNPFTSILLYTIVFIAASVILIGIVSLRKRM